MAEEVTAKDARALLLDAQGLLDDPARRVTLRALESLIERLGFVQVDSIQRVERAHHLILGARLDGYRPELLDRLAFEKRALFENWTHDASFIPVSLFPHWRHRFARREKHMRSKKWFRERLGRTPEKTVARVLGRIEREGPLRARDFEKAADHGSTGWWNWTPEKMALEFLWHTGRLAISSRERFDKVYDLFERAYPEAHAAPTPSHSETIAWACASALERLGAATPLELSDFWDAVTIREATEWCADAVTRGVAVRVTLGAENGAKPKQGVALPDWRARVRRAAEPRAELRLLAPFDPVVRDRKRLERLFAFDYRFEAYTPAPKRKYGYYVLPVLERDRLVGRIDPRRDSENETLVVDGIWWEKGVKPTAGRRKALVTAVEKLAARIGMKDVRVP
jgi:uncharacterized protein YcaQ